MKPIRRLLACTSFITLTTPTLGLLANPTLKLPPSPVNPALFNQEITADLAVVGKPRAENWITLRAKLTDKKGEPIPQGFKIKLSAGKYACTAETGKGLLQGTALCTVEIPFAEVSDGKKFYNVGKKFTIDATLPANTPGKLNIANTSTRTLTLLNEAGYDLHVLPEQFVKLFIIGGIKETMPEGVLFNNYGDKSKPHLPNGSWLYLRRAKQEGDRIVLVTEPKNFNFPRTILTDKYNLQAVTGEFYTNRLYVKPSNMYMNNAQGTFNVEFTASGFDGSGPSIVGLCREWYCPNSLIPDLSNLRFDAARAAYKVGVVNGKLRVQLVDVDIKLNFNCSGAFTLFCDRLKTEVNKVLPEQFRAQLQDPVLLQQTEQALARSLNKSLNGRSIVDMQICPPNQSKCNEGDIMISLEPK